MKPKIITMCGSTRFADLMAVISWEFEKLGYIVLRVNYVPDWYVKKTGWKERTHGAEQDGLKKELDELHCRKIDISDIIFCCNANNYVGESTTNELAYATKIGKPIYAIYGNGDGEGDELQAIARRMEKWWLDAYEI